MKNIEYPLKSGIVLITRELSPISIWYHPGIISIENKEPFVYHNTQYEKNDSGGNIIRLPLADYLVNKRVTEIYDSGLTTEEIKKRISKQSNKKYNWFSFNCEHFIHETTGQRLKRNILHPGEKIAIILTSIALVFLIVRIATPKK